MGYHVTILRTRKGKPHPITKSELDLLIASFPGSRLHSDERNKDVLNLTIARGGKDVSWLTFMDGELWTKNPGDNEIEVMLDIATKLGDGTRVRGDEFETFRTPTETYVHPDDKSAIQQAEESGRQLKKTIRRKQWILNLVLMLIFGGLAGLVIYFSK